MKNNITKRSENFSQWYLDVVREADLAEHSKARGCMVIKPNGYALWENIQKVLDKMIKDTGHKNVYFPIFIPKSLMSKEAEHVLGFAKEMAVVTHHRLIADKDSKGLVVDPESKLEEEFIVRPTSETIINTSFSEWVKSWRDLPVLINQWANVVRWEMRTRLFLRTAEFLWQEGHTVHATEEEAEEETIKMLNVYKDLFENYLAIPVIAGRKSEQEKFPGALRTYSLEAMMQDGKALQMATSHNLGQHFAKAFDIKFKDKDGTDKFAWTTSWGTGTRDIGALIMVHSDDDGLIIPPKVAPVKVAIVPIWRSDEEMKEVLEVSKKHSDLLKAKGISVEIDERDYETPGFKFNYWEKRGVPLRIEIGPKDIEKDQVVLVRRDNKEKSFVKSSDLITEVKKVLDDIQKSLFEKAKKYLEERTVEVNSYEEFKKIIKEKPSFIKAFWNEDRDTELKIKEETKATTRNLPLGTKVENGKDIYTGKEAKQKWIFDVAY